MNPFPYIFLTLAIVAVAVIVIMFIYLGGAQGAGFKPWAVALRCVLLFFSVVCLILAWRTRSSAVFGKQGRLVKWMMKKIYDSDRFDTINLEWSYQKVQSRVLGHYLADKMHGERCIILREPMMKSVNGADSANPCFTGLEEGLEGELKIVKVLDVGVLKKNPPLEPGEEEPVTTGLAKESWTAEDLEDLLASAGEFDLLISCVELPEDVVAQDGRFTLPSLEGRKLALAGGYSKAFDAALANGNVVAAVTYKPDCRFDEKDIPSDDNKAFDNRYVLLKGGPHEETPEDVANEGMQGDEEGKEEDSSEK